MNPKQLKEIIHACQKGEKRAQEQLYRQFSQKMYAVCLFYSGSKSEAEDYLHNGFIKVFQKINTYQEKGLFEAWMRKVFMHTALEKHRRQKWESSLSEKENFLIDENTTPDVLSQLSAKELLAFIQQLTPAYRMVFNLYAIEGYSHKEIARMLEISEGTSKSNLSRARVILQQKVERYYSEKKQANG